MTEFIKLDKKIQNALLVDWLSGYQQLKDGEDDGATPVEYEYNGIAIKVGDRPTVAELAKFKELLISSGRKDSLLGSLFLGDLTVFYEDKSLKSSDELALSGAISGSNEAVRKLGYAEEESKNIIMQSAIGEPRKYLAAKFAQISEINKLSYKTWQEAYAKYRKFGYDEDTAFEKAKKAADAYKDQLMKQHMEQYPEKLTNDAKSRIIDK